MWNTMDTAPHDGSLVRLNIDGTEHRGRWKPTAFLEDGPHTYEWEVGDHHYADRHISGWRHEP